MFKTVKNNIPNAITSCNLLCGSLACIAALHGTGQWWWGMPGYQVAYVLIALAAVADFFDGFVARLIHATSPLGAQLDSLADLVSFGLAPALVLYALMGELWPGSALGYAALWIPIMGAVRLAKFNIDTRQTTSFLGMPIPANAIFWIGFTAWLAGAQCPGAQWMVAALAIVQPLLMVCELPMFSLKVHSLGIGECWRQYALVAACPVLLALCGLPGLALLMLLYVLLSAATRGKS